MEPDTRANAPVSHDGKTQEKTPTSKEIGVLCVVPRDGVEPPTQGFSVPVHVNKFNKLEHVVPHLHQNRTVWCTHQVESALTAIENHNIWDAVEILRGILNSLTAFIEGEDNES